MSKEPIKIKCHCKLSQTNNAGEKRSLVVMLGTNIIDGKHGKL